MTLANPDQRLLTLVGCIRGIVLELDEHARYVNVWADDPALLASSAAEMIGKTIEEVLGAEAGAPFTAQVQRVFATGTVEHFEYPLDLETGRRWFLADIKRVGGTVVFFARDITERRATEQALAGSEERYRFAARATNDVLWDWDLRHDTIRWNDAAREALGFELTGCGKQWKDAVHDDDRAGVIERIDAALAGGASAWSDRYRFRLADGSYGDFVDRGFIARDQAGIATRMVGSMTNVTQLNRIQAKLVKQDRMAALGLLAAGVGHEINNPLTFVKGNLEAALEMMSESDPAREFIADAQDGANRIAEIVQKLRVFKREDRGEIIAVDMHEVIEAAIRMCAVEIRHRARLVRALGQVSRVLSNEAKLQQVLLNVLINATQAIVEGQQESNEIQIATRMERGRVVVTIQDTGVGIAPENLDRVFDPFFTTRELGSGSGLGLSMCHSILQTLGGDIAITSTLGVGTTVTITLPAAGPPVRSAKPRVLVIDDEVLIGRMVQRVLRNADVVALTSAQEALARLLGGERFDLVLCDVMMPGMTGIEFHDELRRAAPELLRHMFFMTGGAFTPRSQAFLDSIGSARVDKPLDSATLRSLLEMHRAPGPQ